MPVTTMRTGNTVTICPTVRWILMDPANIALLLREMFWIAVPRGLAGRYTLSGVTEPALSSDRSPSLCLRCS
jgi:hypothetical protein